MTRCFSLRRADPGEVEPVTGWPAGEAHGGDRRGRSARGGAPSGRQGAEVLDRALDAGHEGAATSIDEVVRSALREP